MTATKATMRWERYLFEQGFVVNPAADTAAATAKTPPPAVYSGDDLARERASAFEEGRAAGLAEAAGSDDARLASATEAVADAIARVLAGLDTVRAAAFGEAIAVAAAVTAKLLPELYRREGESEIEALVAAVLPKLFEEPRVVVRVHPARAAALTERIAGLGARAAFAGRLVVTADPAIADGDCHLDWGSGGAERNGEQLWREIEAVLATVAPRLETFPEGERLRLTVAPPATTTPPPPAGDPSGDGSNDGEDDV